MKLSSHLCRGCMHIKTKIRAASMTARKRSPDPDRERNAAFRSRSWQDAGQLSEDLTYSDQADITVTDSRSFSPHSTCKHMACANYPIFIFYYYSISHTPCKYKTPKRAPTPSSCHPRYRIPTAQCAPKTPCPPCLLTLPRPAGHPDLSSLVRSVQSGNKTAPVSHLAGSWLQYITAAHAQGRFAGDIGRMGRFPRAEKAPSAGAKGAGASVIQANTWSNPGQAPSSFWSNANSASLIA